LICVLHVMGDNTLSGQVSRKKLESQFAGPFMRSGHKLFPGGFFS
jgi:hypothetical protein